MKTMDVERLVAWAFREELPKLGEPGLKVTGGGYGQAWGGIERYGDLLAVVDDDGAFNRYGAVVDFSATTGPHPDALAIGDAVLALDAEPIFVPEGWDPLDDCAAMLAAERGAALAAALDRVSTPDREGERVWRLSASGLVRRYAILGGAPDWHHDGVRPERRPLATANGMPRWFRRTTVWVDGMATADAAGAPVPSGGFVEIEVDGYDAKAKRPHPDAYRKFTWDPDPADLALDRVEWAVWRAALDILAEDLGGRLADHVAVACARTAVPWLEGEATGPAVLDDLSRPVVAGMWEGLRKTPHLAGPTLRRRRPGEAASKGEAEKAA